MERTKERNQQTDLKTEYPYYSCLHEVTFIKSPFACSNSNLVHQQILLNNYLNFTLQSLHYYNFSIMFLRVKSWKSGIAQNQEKSGIIRKIRKCLTDCTVFQVTKSSLLHYQRFYPDNLTGCASHSWKYQKSVLLVK